MAVQDESYKSPEENFAQLQACSTADEARALLAMLTKRERIELNAVSTDLGLGPIHYPYTTPEQPAEFLKPTQGHADQLYRCLFSMVKHALEDAHENGKDLQILVGDEHSDRTALLPMAMLLHICHRLGIEEVGIEVAESEETTFPNGHKKLGLKEMQKEILLSSKGKPLSEFGGITFTGQRRNFDFLAQRGMELGMTLFSGDPAGFIAGGTWDDSLVATFKPREAEMRGVLSKRNDCISYYGTGHLGALQEPEDGKQRLLVSAQNAYLNCLETPPLALFRGFTELPEDAEKAARIGLGERDGDSPLIQVFVDGQLQMARDAMRMAQEADKKVGEELAPFAALSKAGLSR